MYMSSKEFEIRRMLRWYSSISDFRKACETFLEWFRDDREIILKIASERGLVYVDHFGFLEPDEYQDMISCPVSS